MEQIAESKQPRSKWFIIKNETLMIVLTTIMILFGTSNSILMLFVLVLNALYIVKTSEKGIYLLFFLCPFANVYKLSVGAVSFFTYLELIFVARCFYGRRIFEKKFIYLMVFYIILNLFGSGGNISIFLKQVAVPLIIYTCFSMKKVNLKHIVVNYAAGLLLSSAAALFLQNIFPNLSNYVSSARAWGLEEVVIRFSALYTDPNYYTLALVLVLACLMIFVSKDLIGWMPVLLFYIAFIGFGVQTVSKSFFLMLGVTGVLFIFLFFKKKKYNFALLFLFSYCLILIMIVVGKISIFDNIITRLTESSDITTGRAHSWENYFRYFGENPIKFLFGSGLNCGFVNGLAPHNTYIDFLYHYGVTGTIIYWMTVVNAFGTNKKFTKKIENFVPLLCAGMLFFFLSSGIYYDFVFNIIIVVGFYKTDWSTNSVV